MVIGVDLTIFAHFQEIYWKKTTRRKIWTALHDFDISGPMSSIFGIKSNHLIFT